MAVGLKKKSRHIQRPMETNALNSDPTYKYKPLYYDGLSKTKQKSTHTHMGKH